MVLVTVVHPAESGLCTGILGGITLFLISGVTETIPSVQGERLDFSIRFFFFLDVNLPG